MNEVFDFVIIGSGVAGLYSALNFPENTKVLLLTKKRVEDCNTNQAQGGIAAAVDEGDSWKLHAADTLNAGASLCEEEAVEILTKEGPKEIKRLMNMGMEFDHKNGKIDFTLEGAHGKRRILHAGGDATGKKLREFLSEKVGKKKNVKIVENALVLELLKNNSGRVNGVLALEDGIFKFYKARAVILASGGCGALYESTTNPDVATGDGIAMAYEAGAEIMDMEFIQFHPTALYNPKGLSFLISESVRGEGAILLNEKGERFMPKYHEKAELAPRDVVSRAIMSEMKRLKTPYVWLDATHLGSEYIQERFPTIFKTLMKYGIDMRKDRIPVAPAAHYTMGGVKTDTFGRTNIPGLYACGEVACTGVHGANRLASNSLLEGLVFSHRAVLSAQREEMESDDEVEIQKIMQKYENRSKMVSKAKEIRRELRHKLSLYAGVERNESDLRIFLKWIKEKNEELEEGWNEDIWKTRKALTVGALIAKAALLRNESRGAHFRKDHPESKKEWEHFHIITTNKGR